MISKTKQLFYMHFKSNPVQGVKLKLNLFENNKIKLKNGFLFLINFFFWGGGYLCFFFNLICHPICSFSTFDFEIKNSHNTKTDEFYILSQS